MLERPSDTRIAQIAHENVAEEWAWHDKFGIACIVKYIYTHGIIAKCHELGYEVRWCYDTKLEAQGAFKDWLAGETEEPVDYTRRIPPLPEEEDAIKTNGAGKYDDLCTAARENAEADGVAMIIMNGNKGSGFSVQAPKEEVLNLPQTLRFMADQIEKDLNVSNR